MKYPHGCDCSVTPKHRTSRRRTRHAHGAVGPPGDPFGPQRVSQWVSSREALSRRLLKFSGGSGDDYATFSVRDKPELLIACP